MIEQLQESLIYSGVFTAETHEEGDGAEGKPGTDVVLGAVSPKSDSKGTNSRAEIVTA